MEREHILYSLWITGCVLSVVTPPLVVFIFWSGNDDDVNNADDGSQDGWYGGPDGIQALATSGFAYTMTMLMFIALSVYGSFVLRKERELLTQTKEGIYEASDVYNDGDYYLSSDEQTIIVEKKKNYLKLGILRGATIIFGAYSVIVAVLLAVGGGGPPGEWLDIDASTLVAAQFLVWSIHCLFYFVILGNYSRAKEAEDLLPTKNELKPPEKRYTSPSVVVVNHSPKNNVAEPSDNAASSPNNDEETGSSSSSSPADNVEESSSSNVVSPPEGESAVSVEDPESSNKTTPLV